MAIHIFFSVRCQHYIYIMIGIHINSTICLFAYNDSELVTISNRNDLKMETIQIKIKSMHACAKKVLSLLVSRALTEGS